MDLWKKEELEKHKNHKLEIVKYKDGKVFMECITCKEVLFQIIDNMEK